MGGVKQRVDVGMDVEMGQLERSLQCDREGCPDIGILSCGLSVP